MVFCAFLCCFCGGKFLRECVESQTTHLITQNRKSENRKELDITVLFISVTQMI
jgi:uncharacterized radical SAM superfamily protein